MPESLGPHFFAQVLRREEKEHGIGHSDDAPRKIYLIELSATGLGKKSDLYVVSKFCADQVALELSGGDNTGKDQQEKAGSATVSMSETTLQKSGEKVVSCTIEQLDVDTEDNLTDMQALVAILRRIQSLCIEIGAQHLAMTGNGSFRGSPGLLKHAGFNLCDCEHPYNNVKGVLLCIDLPTSPMRSPAHKHQDSPLDGSSDWEKGRVAAVAKSALPIAKPAKPEGPLLKKEYCSHWILRGECAYMQMGCKYKHHIPHDKKTRERIGMGEIPHWFRQSSHWSEWLEQVDPTERGELTLYGHETTLVAAQRSGGRSDSKANSIGSGGKRKALTPTRHPIMIGPYTVGSPHRNHRQDTNASNIKAEKSPAGPSLATTIDSTEAINIKTSRRLDRLIDWRSKDFVPPVVVKRENQSNGESSDVWGSDVEARIRGRGKRRKHHKDPSIYNR